MRESHLANNNPNKDKQPLEKRQSNLKKFTQDQTGIEQDELLLKMNNHALINCNELYDEKYITLGNLLAVVNDFKNAKQTSNMIGILPENTLELKDTSY